MVASRVFCGTKCQSRHNEGWQTSISRQIRCDLIHSAPEQLPASRPTARAQWTLEGSIAATRFRLSIRCFFSLLATRQPGCPYMITSSFIINKNMINVSHQYDAQSIPLISDPLHIAPEWAPHQPWRQSVKNCHRSNKRYEL